MLRPPPASVRREGESHAVSRFAHLLIHHHSNADMRETYVMNRRHDPARRPSSSWDAVADWYEGWSGVAGSRHHRQYAIPVALELLGSAAGYDVLDLGCGPGPMAAAVAAAGGRYTGVDLSRKLLAAGRRRYGRAARFIHGDATRLEAVADLTGKRFDAVTFLLSIQDINPLEAAIGGAASLLLPRGVVIVVMTHPCFRVPRQSGWGWDPRRKLRFRRVDSYLSRLAVPMGGSRRSVTRSYHRPLGDYINALAAAGLHVDAAREIAVPTAAGTGVDPAAERRAEAQFPLFLALRARKT